MKKIVTLIPARGGSKGIKRKNIVDVNGSPLLTYAIEASRTSMVDETWVSTDDDEIAEVSRKYGAQVIQRPSYISNDDSTSELALLHFSKRKSFDILVFIQATCPFIKSEDIDNAIKLMDKYDSVISVSKFDQFLWSGSAPMYEINNRLRRQDRIQNYVETGSIFVTTRQGLMDSKNRISGNVGFVHIPRWRSIDIDTYEDLELVRKIMQTEIENKL
jgi:CMP-N,N'-diacetyllegionaminic acid synthase